MTGEDARHDLGDLGGRVPEELVAFGRALELASEGLEPLDWPSFLEKPWKWAREYRAWVELDRPNDDERNWSRFVTALEVVS